MQKRSVRQRETATIQSLNLHGLQCTPVEIEVDIANGLPAFIIVGLPDAAVFEARDRVRSAIKNSGYDFPRTRVTVNLAPAHSRKVGPLFDLPMALGILVASGTLPSIPKELCVGELALGGRLRAVRGALPIVHTAIDTLGLEIIIPADNAAEASLVESGNIYTAQSLRQVVNHILERKTLERVGPAATYINFTQHASVVDMQDIVGQHMAKRAVEIAAAGMHNIFFTGPPGVGKSMLAKVIPSILPPMKKEEMIETTMIHSLIDPNTGIVHQRPFRAPHHTASPASLIGGGVQLRPGEISLAHRGVLFFDELPEFRRDVLEALRQPLEDGEITLHRVHGTVTYPARALMVTAQNPCPCGYRGQLNEKGTERCHCSARALERYSKKISGPLMDRMDLKVHVPAVAIDEIVSSEGRNTRESSAAVQVRTTRAYTIQLDRQQKPNAELSQREIESLLTIDSESQALLNNVIQNYTLSMRGYTKTLKVARTIADLAGQIEVQKEHIAESLSYTLPLDQRLP